jgi:3-oxoacyl-[acyl-carrier-protein] synthase II
MRRVVVTGLGLVTPLGTGVEYVWAKLLAGESGIRAVDAFDVSDLPVRIAGMVPRGQAPGELDPDAFVARKDQRRIADFILYALAAGQEALAQAGWTPSEQAARDRTGVAMGSGIGGLPMIEDNAIRLAQHGPRRISPYFIPGSIVNEASAALAIRYGFRGPNHAVATACATGAHAISDAARMIMLDEADVMLAGGSEAAVSRLSIAGFAIMRALSSAFNADPARASRPWDRDRDGFVLGEGAGVLVLEEREHALRRGARIHGELLGYGLSSDAYHVTAPDPEGGGALLAMRAALARARLTPSDIDYIHAHATSTPLGDPIELRAVQSLFGASASDISMSASKAATGHLLGAAGALGAVFSLLAIAHQVAPPTRNLDRPDELSPIDLVPHTARPRRIRSVLSNSFAFGGANASLIFGPG